MANAPAVKTEPVVVNCRVYRKGVSENISIDAISDVLAVDDDSFVWVGLYEPDPALLKKLQEEFCLHDLAIEDALMAHQRPKIEAFGTTLFIAVHTTQLVDEHVRFGETHIFYGNRFLITVRHGASKTFAIARDKLEQQPDYLAMGPSVALHGVLDFVVDNYVPIVNDFEEELDSLEQSIFAEEEYRRDTIQRLYTLRKELTQMRMAVLPMQDIISQLVRSENPSIPDVARPYFRDIRDHAGRTADIIDTLRETASAAMSTNLSLVTIHQGEVVKKLAGWAGLLAVPTLIASWYGMNFKHIPELDGPYAYPTLIVVVAVACASLYRYLKKVRWL
ncbi:magnesium and cobalt transport protein CorA [Lysobacter sp. HDW10]|uniref:magnesium and cobalt transport protein CorA n=1 Tax=Lysobacter sp. HDW10 TaxID=2714936 RepID=UPI0014078AE4|nr:magnesium and cobalt transport protein CorA [Lysobacter sp. HDW10]QIK80246.1 magnesium and cobalt transport protein CorA [Lysobacter sp. HDW10]